MAVIKRTDTGLTMKVQAEIGALGGLFEALVRLQPAPAIDSRR